MDHDFRGAELYCSHPGCGKTLFEHDTVQERADESVTPTPTPGLGGLPVRPRTNRAPNVLALKALVYGSCAGIVLCCLIWVIWLYWP